MGIFDVEESNPTIMWNNISSSANNDLATSPYNPLTLTPLKLTLKESTSWRLVHDEGKWWRPVIDELLDVSTFLERELGRKFNRNFTIVSTV